MGTQRSTSIEKALGPVLFFIRETTNLFEFVERRYYEYRFGRTSKSAKYADRLSFRVRKDTVHTLKLERNLTGSQCNVLLYILARHF